MSPRVIHNLWTMLECLQKTNKTLTEQNASDQNQLRALEAEIKRLKKRVAALDVESAQLLEI